MMNDLGHLSQGSDCMLVLYNKGEPQLLTVFSCVVVLGVRVTSCTDELKSGWSFLVLFLHSRA